MSSDDDLWDMKDEDLEAAFKAAKAEENSPETDIEESPEELDDVSNETTDDLDEEELDDSENSDESSDEDDVNDGSDQPEVLLEESDHDSSDDAEDDDVDEDKTTETDEDKADGTVDTDDEESSDETEESEEEEQPTRSYQFRANGKDYEFSSEEIVDQFPKIFGKAMDYTKKMQTIKPWRKTIDAIEGAKISHEDVSLMIDVLKGDKEAITEVLKRTGTDTLELDTEKDSGYEVKDYGRDESALAISDIVDEIGRDAEYATTQNILDKEWDEASWSEISENPQMIKLLHADVKSGVYKTLQPIAEKLKVFGGGTKSDLEYYKEAAQQHFTHTAKQKSINEQKRVKKQESDAAEEVSAKRQEKLDKVKAESNKRVATKKASAKRKAAAPAKAASADRVTDYLDDSDENFDDWYKTLQDSM